MLKVTKQLITGSCLVLCSIYAVHAVAQQDESGKSGIGTTESKDGVPDVQIRTNRVETARINPDAKMSTAIEPVTGSGEKLETAPTALVTGSQFTAMAPGICLVVDELVREFCSANPDDISCQFQ